MRISRLVKLPGPLLIIICSLCMAAMIMLVSKETFSRESEELFGQRNVQSINKGSSLGEELNTSGTAKSHEQFLKEYKGGELLEDTFDDEVDDSDKDTKLFTSGVNPQNLESDHSFLKDVKLNDVHSDKTRKISVDELVKLVDRVSSSNKAARERNTANGLSNSIVGKDLKNLTSVANLMSQSSRNRLGSTAQSKKQLHKQMSELEQRFIFQMSDLLSMDTALDKENSNLYKTRTEEEANAADATEYDSLKVYGSREEDIMTFVQVKEGSVKEDSEQLQERIQNVQDGLPLLTLDLLKTISKDNLVIVACASWKHYAFALNWVTQLRKHGVTNYLIGALDHQTSIGFASMGVQGFKMFPSVPGTAGLTQEFASGTESAHRLSRQKTALARLFTNFGYEMLFSSVDVMWTRNPTKFFTRMEYVNILVASDQTFTSKKSVEFGLENPTSLLEDVSLSIFYVRPSPSVNRFILDLDTQLSSRIDRADTLAFSTVVLNYMNPLVPHAKSSYLAHSGKNNITMGVLSTALFMNGNTFFVQQMHKELNVKPFSIHVNYIEGGLKSKIHRLREIDLWPDTPAYFNDSIGYLKVTMPTVNPPNIKMSDQELLQHHVQDINKQFKLLRTGIILSIILERILILPEFYCYCDLYWASQGKCRAEDNNYHFPKLHVCPLDHLVAPYHFDEPGLHHGPKVFIREYNFLARARNRGFLKEDYVLALPKSENQSHPNNTMPIVYLNPLQSEVSLLKSLKKYKSASVLGIAKLEEFDAYFENKKLASYTSKRLSYLNGVWLYNSNNPMVYGMEV